MRRTKTKGSRITNDGVTLRKIKHIQMEERGKLKKIQKRKNKQKQSKKSGKSKKVLKR